MILRWLPREPAGRVALDWGPMTNTAQPGPSPRSRACGAGSRPAGGGGRRGNGHDAPGQRRPRLSDFDGHEGCNEILNVTRPDIVRARARGLPGRRRGLHYHQHVRRKPRQPGRIRADRADRGTVRGGCPDRPGGGRPVVRPGPAALGARLGRARHQAAHPRPRQRSPSCATPTRSALPACSAAAPTRSSSRPARTCSRPRRPSSARRRAMAAAGADAAADRAGDHRDHRRHAAGQRDRRRADRAGAAGHRPDRAELRDRAGRDERAPALPGRPLAPAAVLHAQRRPARTHRRRRPVPAQPGPAGRRARHVHRRVRAGPGRRVLRHHAGAPGRRGGPGARAGRWRRRRPRPEPGVASLYQHVPFRQDTAFLAIGERTNANGSKAFREALLAGRYDDCVEIARAQTRDGAHLLDVCVDYVGRDGAGRHGRGGQPARHRVHAAAGARLHRAGGDQGRAGAAGRPGGGELGQLRGRRRARTRGSPRVMPMVRRARRRGDRADDRRAGPGPDRRLEGGGGQPADRGPDRPTGACGSATSSWTA